MKYVRVLFLKEVGAFVGSDGKVYGPYSPGDEAVIPEEDARALALQGAVARVGGYVVEEGGPASTISTHSTTKSMLNPLLFMVVGFALIVVGFILMAFSTANAQGWVWYFPLPPISLSGPVFVLLAVLPLLVMIIFFIVFLYLIVKS